MINASRQKTFLGSIALLSALVLSACGKGQNLDDYNRSKLAEDLARVAPVVGNFSGYVTSKTDKSVLGVLNLSIQTDSQNTSFKDQTGVIKTVLRFEGVTSLTTVLSNSSYNPDTGVFRATKTVDDATLTSRVNSIDLTGSLNGDSFVGNLQATGLEEFGATIELKRDGKAILNQSFDTSTLLSEHTEYLAESTDIVGNKTTTKMVLTNGALTQTDQFVSLFVPFKKEIVTLSIQTPNGNNAPLWTPFFTASDVVYDAIAKTLSRSSSANNATFSCKEANTQTGLGFRCVLIGTGSQNSSPAEFLFQPVANQGRSSL